ncbi:arrestin domain-containing protein [Xylariaceae sp. FL1272]|nr:arrestin domain-containing protein [Xylariaceae sp. FL1272]
MPSFNPFASAASRHSYSLFEIRLENDFVVFRGNDDEASGQILKGVLVLCLGESMKVDDVHLRLTGQCRITWLDGRQTPSGIHNSKIDKTTQVLRHTWPPFVGQDSHHNTLAPGNYEWPFEIELPGNTPESVEGLFQTGITYLLKGTVARGNLKKNLHCHKRVRIVRTLDPAALEFNHAMSVENVWPDKIEYSLVIPRKAIVFGTSVPLEMRFSPLLKGLELGGVTVRLFESQEFTVQGPTRTHKYDREVTTWNFEVTREKHWLDNIEETGQEGWFVKRDLPLPKKLNRLIQDCTVQGIKIRHKLKLTIALNNPDGHVSELRATLPVTIFISPNVPLDEEGNIVAQATDESSTTTSEDTNLAPPGYGQHILDQLYDGVDTSGIMTPGIQSGVSTPFYAQSRHGSSENLAAILHGSVPPAALTSRLQNMSLDDHRRRSRHSPYDTGSGTISPPLAHDGEHGGDSSHPQSGEPSRRPSEDGVAHHHHHHDHSGHGTPPEHTELPSLEQLAKVPSYNTATRTPLPRSGSFMGSLGLPDYMTATSAPPTPAFTNVNPMDTITERTTTEPQAGNNDNSRSPSSADHSRSNSRIHAPSHAHIGSLDGERLLRLLQRRGTDSNHH